ncbi:hypothetical protein [Methanobacterium ferruginis]|uniref:hypothetical protein n=1 Tax=Methanobacterium ferruginis TaxID=710191 RepID=UPI0025734404|nr:hypothetical protein [Methanobacterium ferruginis]BDZ68569.1 hypothetical protein GCM10025860_20170 [Methanobacterium ferruginis]
MKELILLRRENNIPLLKISTKKGIHRAFEDVIRRHGPQTCSSIVDTVKMEYKITRVQIDKDRAAQYLVQNPNIIILGDIQQNGKVHLYGLHDVDYNCKTLAKVVA